MIWAVIVTRNRRALLFAGCLAAVAEQTRPLDQILVVDNASDDGTSEWLRAETTHTL